MIRSLIVLIFSVNILFSADLVVEINPDSIFVGSLVTLSVSIKNLAINEIPLFHDFTESSGKFHYLGKSLNKNSAEYTLQFWEMGPIVLSPFKVGIKNKKQEI